MSEFREYRCWDRKTVQETIWSDVGAFGVDEDALFLATHVSLPVERIKPVSELIDENAVLRCLQEAIDAAGTRNLVVAVTGPSGSGKSHLVRWVRAQLGDSDSRLEIVYIPRRVTTLREIAHLLLQRLGGSIAEELQVELDRAVGNTGPRYLALALLNRLTEILTYRPVKEGADFAESLLPVVENDGADVGHGGLAYLIGQDKVKEHLLRAGGTLDRLAHSILGQRGAAAEDGSDEKPSFTSEELDLTRLTGIRSGLPKHTSTALSMLTKDSARSAAAGLLNRHRDAAIQEVLGMRQGRGLHEVFSDARRRLHGKQLVLMFEDLALMDFVEGAVLDEFANHGNDQHAPLRVVFAVTDDKYATLAETIEGRVTDHFRVGEVPLHDPSSDSNQQPRRREFFGRYFNAGRVGRDALVAARSAGDPIPNKCTTCDHRVVCHEAFGAVETEIGPIGLYPLNDAAIRHGVAKQFNDRHQEQRVLTPRIVVDNLIKFVLLRAHDDLTNDSMPSKQLVSVMVDGSAMMTPVELVPQFEEGSLEQDRYFGVRAYWFDCRKESEEVAEAFALPAIRSGEEDPPDPAPPPSPPSDGDEPGPLPEAAQAVVRWAQGENLDPRTSGELRGLLHTMTEHRVALDRFLVHSTSPVTRALLKAALGDASFDIEGAPSRSTGKQLEFRLPRSNASARLLISAIWLRDHDHWDFARSQRRWSVPFQETSNLAVELETFLGACVAQVEGAVVGSLFVSGTDPVVIAVAEKYLAESSAVIRFGRGPAAWATASREAEAVLQTVAADDIVLAFAGARQSPRASPAAIDTLRTRRPGWDELPGEPTELPEAFVNLVHSWGKLRRAVVAAVEPTGEEVLRRLDEVHDLVGDDTLASVAEAAADAITLANNENALDSETQVFALTKAVDRLRASSFGPVSWTQLVERVRAGDQDLGLLLDMLPSMPELIDAHEDLTLIHRTLVRTRAVIDRRITSAGGTGSPDAVRTAALEAHAALLTQLHA